MNRFLRVFSILIAAIFLSTSISLAFVSPADYEKIKKAKKDKTVQLEKKKKIAGPVRAGPFRGFRGGFFRPLLGQITAIDSKHLNPYNRVESLTPFSQLVGRKAIRIVLVGNYFQRAQIYIEK